MIADNSISNNLSILCVTQMEDEVLPLINKLIQQSNELDCELVLAIDYGGDYRPNRIESVVDDLMESECNLTICRVDSKGYIESCLDDAISYTTGKYVFRIDDDESIPDELLNWLHNKTYLAADNWKFARAHLYGDSEHYILNPQLYPDHQTRLSIREKSGNRSSVHAGSPYGGGELCPFPLYHHKFIIKSLGKREKLVQKYNNIQENMGTCFAPFSVPELTFDNIHTEPIDRLQTIYSPEYVDLIINHSFSVGMYQHLGEIKPFYEYLLSKNIKNIIEIGTLKGGTATLFHSLLSNSGAEKGKIISVDLPDGRFGSKDFGYNQTNSEIRNIELARNLPNFIGILGNSHDTLTFDKVKGNLNGELADLLFIDGDHTYEGVQQDFEMYSDLIKPDGIIAFHDILDTPIHRTVGCEVDKLWSELKEIYKYKCEFIEFSVNGPWGGIGVMEVSELDPNK